MDDFEIELKRGFLDEATQGLQDVEQCFLILETNPEDQDNLNKIFRLAHNLKGSSRAVGFEDMGHFTHALESFILKIKNGELSACPSVVSILLQAIDYLKWMIEEYQKDLSAKIDPSEWISKLEHFDPSSINQQDSQISNSEESQPDFNLEANQDSHSSIVTLSKELKEDPSPASSKRQKAGLQASHDQSIRVSLFKVESLINLVGELVILQSVLEQQVMKGDSQQAQKALHQLSKVSKEIQDLSMGLRMVPILPTFQKMLRIVRDTSLSVGKEVDVELDGGETELDKTVLEYLTDPLVHLVRNAVDHGIEKPEVRVEKGKPARGKITLRACHRADRLIIEIEDDGGGIDPEKVRTKAIEKGILSPNKILSEQEIIDLIFAPGFSTKEQVTDISGRGVGMDVVKTNINELGGEISIRTKLHQGTCFQISLPLTLAIVEAMIVTYSKQRFVVPLGQVYETLRVDPNILTFNTHLGDTLNLRGENIPIARLGDYLGIAHSHQNKVKDMIGLVCRSTNQPFAIVVDDILGQGQVVVKKIPEELRGISGVLGVTILGDGLPALILDLIEMSKRKKQKNSPLKMAIA